MAKKGKAGPGLGGTHLARRASCRSLGQTHWWLPLPKMVSAMLGAPSQRGASHLGEKGKKKACHWLGCRRQAGPAGPAHGHCQPLPVRCPGCLEAHHQNHSSSQTLFPPNSSFKGWQAPGVGGRRLRPPSTAPAVPST